MRELPRVQEHEASPVLGGVLVDRSRMNRVRAPPVLGVHAVRQDHDALGRDVG